MNVIEQRQALKRRKRGREREREGKREGGKERGREREREGGRDVSLASLTCTYNVQISYSISYFNRNKINIMKNNTLYPLNKKQ